jgi:hypothetical protein
MAAFSGLTKGDEASHPYGACVIGELLEQPRADSPSLELVGDRERGLRRLRLAQARIAGQCHDALVSALAGERADESPSITPVALQEWPDELWAD